MAAGCGARFEKKRIAGWRMMAQQREEWKKVVKEVKVLKGL